MAVFADPRARALFPDGEEPTEFTLHRWDGKVIASATCYGSWWGVSSHRSRVPVAMRATSAREARELLMTTVWLAAPGEEEDEFAGYGDGAKRGTLYIRSLLDEEVLEAARDERSAAWKQIFAFLGGSVNRSWITSRCAEEAYFRGLIDGQEFGWLAR